MDLGCTEVGKALSEIIGEMSDRNVIRALRNTFAAEGRKVAKAAKVRLSAMWPKSNGTDLVRGIRSKVTRDGLGYVVKITPGKKGAVGMHFNRWGHLKPALFWGEVGVDGSKRPGGKGVRPKLFMESVRQQEIPKSEARIAGEFEKQVRKTARKYGGS